MTTNGDLAILSAVLPDRPWRRPRLLRTRARGLEGVPERYRLQFAVLAAQRLPGEPPQSAVALADMVADRVRPPRRLLDPQKRDGLDEWFRGQVPVIETCLDNLTGAQA